MDSFTDPSGNSLSIHRAAPKTIDGWSAWYPAHPDETKADTYTILDFPRRSRGRLSSIRFRSGT